MNSLGSVSDKLIFMEYEKLCLYSFLIFEVCQFIDLICFHNFSLELLIL